MAAPVFPRVRHLAEGLDCSMERYALSHLPVLDKNQAVVGFILCDGLGEVIKGRTYDTTNRKVLPVFTSGEDWDEGLVFGLTEALFRSEGLIVNAVVRTLHSTSQQ
jgi:hypothetical protein